MKLKVDIKTPMHMRLTGTARRLMATLARRKGISQTAVVEMAVRLIAAQADRDTQEFKAAMNANRQANGERPVYP
jgi:hypothetical protein